MPTSLASPSRLVAVLIIVCATIGGILFVLPEPAWAGGVVNACTSAALSAALAGGGSVTFATGDCTITVASPILLNAPTTIDGAGQRITLSGGGTTRIFTSTTSATLLRLKNITLTNGLGAGGYYPNNSGGALFMRGDLVLSNTTFISNSAAGYGGGFFAGGVLTMSNSHLVSNVAGGYGGGAFALGPATVDGGLIQKNKAPTGHGGGLYTQGTLALTGTLFLENFASYYGGGLYTEGAAWLTTALIEGNSAQIGGGGLASSAPVVFSGTQFINNSAAGNGGAIYANSSIAATGGMFQGNHSNGTGGGLVTYGQLSLTGTQVLDNVAQNGGGGALANNAVTLTGARFQNNISIASYGGGLYSAFVLSISNTEFIDNRALVGGALLHTSGDGHIVNTLFARNVATTTNGAALSQEGYGSLAVVHSTIASPTFFLGSAMQIAGGTIGITDTIVASHTIFLNHAGGNAFEDYNLWPPLILNSPAPTGGGAHDVYGDPKFVDPASDNYHLRTGSPAIDNGFDTGLHRDFDGDYRPQGGSPDIGYDEFNVPITITPLAGANGSITPGAPQVVAAGTTITFTISPNTNYHIAGVFVDGVSQGAPNSYTFHTVSSNHTISATFALNTYSLSVGLAGPGTGTVNSTPAGIHCNPTCSASFGVNSVVTLTASPTPGSALLGWSGACAGSGICSVTMNLARQVTAKFGFGLYLPLVIR